MLQPESRAGFLLLLSLAFLSVAVTRLPLASPYLYSYDEVSFAWALDHFDPRIGQPQPPGYPLLVAAGKLFRLVCTHPEHIFSGISLLTSVLVLPVLVLFGRRILGSAAGWYPAALLLLNPVFWLSGLTSPSRPQLALLTAVVGYMCWRAREGEQRWMYYASLALGLGAGFRPCLLVLLFPLWVACAWRHRPAAWGGLGLLALAAGTWLLPLMWVTGGPLEMTRGFWQYLAEQSAPTSPLFGASLSRWRFMVGRMFVWNLIGLLVPLAVLPLALRGTSRQSVRDRLAFFTLWAGPCFLFELLVHIASPDHALMTVPALCVLGGAVLARLPVGRALAGLSLAVNALVFLYPYLPPDPGPEPPRASLLRSARDAVYYGTVETSYRVVYGTQRSAEHTLRSLAEVAQVDPPPVLVWKGANFGWRRTIFYLPRVAIAGTSVIVLRDRRHVEAREPVAEYWENGRVVSRRSGQGLHIPLPAHRRIVWMVGANTAFTQQLARQIPLHRRGNLFYTDPSPVAQSFFAGDFVFDIAPEQRP